MIKCSTRLNRRSGLNSSEIISDIMKHVGSETYGNWYVGIAGNPTSRLFTDHAVDKQNGKWIYRKGDSDTVARTAEGKLHDQGFDGGKGGGDSTTVYVYAYRKTSTTKE